MSDNRKWWKTWSCIIHDAKFQNIPLADIGFWTLLMSLICEQGERGKITIIPPALVTVALLRCGDLATLKMTLERLPNVQITPPINDNGDFIVTIRKWFTYQVDPTASVRVKRSRYKKRGEEKLTSKSTSTPSPRLAASLEASPPALGENGEDERINAMTCKRCDYHLDDCKCDELEQRERNKEWRKELPEIPKSECMTPEEMKAIRIKNFGYFKGEKRESQSGGKT